MKPKGAGPRWTHVRDKGLYLDWWPDSKKKTVFCQSTGFRGSARSERDVHRILDSLESRAVIRR